MQMGSGTLIGPNGSRNSTGNSYIWRPKRVYAYIYDEDISVSYRDLLSYGLSMLLPPRGQSASHMPPHPQKRKKHQFKTKQTIKKKKKVRKKELIFSKANLQLALRLHSLSVIRMEKLSACFSRIGCGVYKKDATSNTVIVSQVEEIQF